MPVAQNEIQMFAKGGTELSIAEFKKYVDPELLDKFYIHFSRYRGPDPERKGRKELYFIHDLPGDPELDHLRNGGYNKFEKLVFVTNWQLQNFIAYYGIPWAKCEVIKNAIEPIDINLIDYSTIKGIDRIKLIYHTTPHRGLEILVPVFEELSKQYPIELDVFSSFKAYGWAERDKPYEELFKRCEKHPNIWYHGAADLKVVRDTLRRSHIFSYPGIWMETSCRSLMEALSAGLICVHPNYGALYETAANWSFIYQYQPNKNDHALVFKNALEASIKNLLSVFSDEQKYIQFSMRMKLQKIYADQFYSWELRSIEWNSLLKSLL